MSPDKQPNQTQVALVEHFGCDARTGGPRPIRVTSAPGAAEPGGRRSRHRGRRATARLSPSVTPIRAPGEQNNLIPAVLLATPSAAMTCPSAARIGNRTGADRHLFRPVPATVPAKVKSQPAHPFRLLGHSWNRRASHRHRHRMPAVQGWRRASSASSVWSSDRPFRCAIARGHEWDPELTRAAQRELRRQPIVHGPLSMDGS